MHLSMSFVLAAILVGHGAYGALAQAPLPMKDYSNVRFGYHVSYPLSLLKPLPEADDGDGRVFQPANGHADIRVSGGYVSGDSDQTIGSETKSAL